MKLAPLFAAVLVLCLALPAATGAKGKKPMKFCKGKDKQKYEIGKGYLDTNTCIQYTCVKNGKRLKMKGKKMSKPCTGPPQTPPTPTPSIPQQPSTTPSIPPPPSTTPPPSSGGLEAIKQDIQDLKDVITSMQSTSNKHGTCLSDVTSTDCPASGEGKMSMIEAIRENKDAIEVNGPGSSVEGDPLFTILRPFVCDTGSCFQVEMNPAVIQTVCFHTSASPSTFEFNEKLFSFVEIVPPRSSLFKSEDGTQAIFTCGNGTALYGSIPIDGAHGKFRTLNIEQSNNIEQIITYLPESDLPIDEGVPDIVDDQSESSEADPDLLQQGASDSTTLARYSIKFYYTPQFAADTSDVYAFIDQALAVTNLGYVNSRVPLEAYSLCAEQATINDQASASKMLNDFRTMKGSVSKLRGGADIAALLVKEFDACGIAYVHTVVNGGSTVSVTMKRCILGYYSLGHEIGHNIGLLHDPANSNNNVYPEGHGHLIQAGSSSTGKRTILAYNAVGHSGRVNYYSNPAVIHPETKTPTGVTGVSNNAAVLIRNRFVLQSIGEGQECDGGSSTETCLTSPGYPNDYPDNSNVEHALSVAAGQAIQITFHHFDVETEKNCNYDSLKFLDGNSNTIGEKMCGKSLPPKMTISTSTARAVFKSDYSVRKTGYKFCYKSTVTCPAGWTSLATGCYHVTQSETFNNANGLCKPGGHLVEVNNQIEQDTLRTWYRDIRAWENERVWLGATDSVTEGDWKWIHSGQSITISNWHPEEPNNSGGNEDCAVGEQNQFKWQDVPCSLSYRAICEYSGCCRALKISATGTSVDFLSGTWNYVKDYEGKPAYKFHQYYLFYYQNRWVVEPSLGYEGSDHFFGYLRFEGSFRCPENVGPHWKHVYDQSKVEEKISMTCEG